jgi:hypothetical protein
MKIKKQGMAKSVKENKDRAGISMPGTVAVTLTMR